MANLKENLLVNRIIALLVGGLLVFGIMSLTVVQTGKKQLTAMAVELDTSRYEAGRLLDDATAQLNNKDYDKSKESLEKLFTNQPGSPEAIEGKALLISVETAQSSAEARWNAALPRIKKEWSEAMAAELRAESDKKRADMEAGLEKTIAQAWDKAESNVRADWEKEI